MTEPLPSIAISTPSEISDQLFYQPPYKPKCDPCPWTTLQSGTKSTAIFSIILSCLWFMFCVAILIDGEHYGDNVVLGQDGEGKIFNFDSLIVEIVINIVFVILSIFLYLGARQWNKVKCRVYFIGTPILVVAAVILGIIVVTTFDGHIAFVINEILPICLFLFISLYFETVVYFFMEEIAYNPHQAEAPEQQFKRVVRPLSYHIGAASVPAQNSQSDVL